VDRGRDASARVGARLIADLFPTVQVAEPRRATLRGREVAYVLKRSRRRRTVAFTVDESGLVVHAPWRASLVAVETTMERGARWIVAKLDEWSRRPKTPVRGFGDGASVEYLGRALTLALVADALPPTSELRDDGTLVLRLPPPHTEAAVRTALSRWYRRHALPHFSQRAQAFAHALGVEPPRVFLSNAATRWGSCNAKREVRLNWRLMQMPPELIDYVVAHEVAHLVHLNHSARFWRTVEKVYPDHESARRQITAQTRHWMGA
jgi:hypothetical protein